jgi:hypothetical protein
MRFVDRLLTANGIWRSQCGSALIDFWYLLRVESDQSKVSSLMTENCEYELKTEKWSSVSFSRRKRPLTDADGTIVVVREQLVSQQKGFDITTSRMELDRFRVSEDIRSSDSPLTGAITFSVFRETYKADMQCSIG